MAMRTNPALPPPLTSTSTSSRPSDLVTCCAISSIFAAITCRIVVAIAGANKKVGFRPLHWLDNSIYSVPCLLELRKRSLFRLALKRFGDRTKVGADPEGQALV